MLTDRLRTETRHLHDRLEASENATKIMSQHLTKAEYIDLLNRYYAIHQILESQLADFEEMQMEKRARLELITEDLRDLNSNISQTSESQFTIPDLSHAYGVLYVLEGSRLGGQLISRKLQEQFGEAIPVKYFYGHGNKTMPEFIELQTELNNADINHDLVVKSANDTFEFFLERLA